MKEQKFQFMTVATDMVTGFTGIITGFAQYTTGCNQYLLEPMMTASQVENGDRAKGQWFDEERLGQ